MKRARKFCKSGLQQLFIALLSLLIIIALILFAVFVLIPVYIYRAFVGLAAYLFRPDLASFVHPRSAISATDDLHVRPTLTLLEVNTVLGNVGPGDLDRMKTHILEAIVKKKNERGQLQYPELQQHYFQWLGFVFWKWVDSFDINNHVRVHPESEVRPMDEVDVAKLRLHLVRKPWVEGQSPWELVIVKNYQPKSTTTHTPKCVFISRAHHGLCDGYSLLQAFVKHAVITERGKQAMKDAAAIPRPNFQPRNVFQIGLHYLCAFVSTPYHLASQLVLEFGTGQRNQLQAQRGSDLVRQVYPGSTRVSMADIGTIREVHKVTFTAVILAALAGGLRKFMKDNEMKVPKYVYVITPLPWPNHPADKLINYWTYAVVTLPLRLKSAEERLRFTHANWEGVKRSTLPTMNFYLVPLLGRLTVGLMKFVAQIKSSNATLILSNFPGPPSGVDFLGYPVQEASFGGGLGPGNLGMGMAMMSNNGVLSMNVGVDHAILGAIGGQPKAQELISNVNAEIQMLCQDSTV